MRRYYKFTVQLITAPLWLGVFLICLLVGVVYVFLMLPIIAIDATKEFLNISKGY